MAKKLIVEKEKFDNALRKLAQSQPLKKSEVKPDKKKPAQIIPPQDQQSGTRK